MLNIEKYFGVGERIQIELMKNNEIERYISQVVEIYENGSMDILAPIHKNRIVFMTVGSAVKIVLPKGEAVYEIKAKIVEKMNTKIPMLKISITSDLVKIQRRNFFRLRIIRDIELKKVEDLKQNKFGEVLKCTALDISAGGMLVNTSSELEESNLLEVSLNLNNKNMIILGKIVRKSLAAAAKYKYEYGIRFENITEFERNQITKYIFEEQRKLIRKGLI